MWFFDFAPHWRQDKSFRYRLLFFWAGFVFLSGLFICGAGVSQSVGSVCALLTMLLDVRLGRGYQDQLREQRRNLALEL